MNRNVASLVSRRFDVLVIGGGIHGLAVAYDAARRRVIDLRRLQLEGMRGALNVLGPQATLARGYAIVSRDGLVVRHAASVQAGDALTVRFSDGDIAARAES